MKSNTVSTFPTPYVDEMGRDYRILDRATTMAEVARLIESVRAANADGLKLQKCFASSTQIAWHYTKGTSFIDIIAVGKLMLQETVFSKVPVAWFSLDQEWELTGQVTEIPDDGLPRSLGKSMTHNAYCGLFRFGTPAGSLKAWREGKKLLKFKKATIDIYEDYATRHGADTNLWMVAFEEICVDDLMIEYWDGVRWNCIQDPSAGSSHVWLANTKGVA